MNKDIVVIGAGPAGLSVAISTGLLGLDVLLVEKENIGGDCTHHGCVPSKALLKSAGVAETVGTAGKYGVEASLESIDFPAVMERVQDVIDGVAEEESAEELEQYGVEVMSGEAAFVDEHAVDVDGTIVQADKFAICTGSVPLVPPIDGLENVDYRTNRSLFDMQEQPERLGIIGAGPIGTEMAQAFARLGSEVVMYEGASHILNREDVDVARMLMHHMERDGVTFHTGEHVNEVVDDDGIVLRGDTEERVDELLVATGQRAATRNLDLEKAGVATEDGRIVTNDKLQASHSHIYAAGDVVGPYQFTHVAEEMAKTVVWNMISPWKDTFDDTVVPWCTFTDPELARVGVNEEEAGEEHTVHTIDGAEVDRFRTDGHDNGIIKLVSKDGGIEGVTALLPNAGEVIQEFVLAMENGLSVDDVADTIHTYPTMADANKWVAYEHERDRLTPFVKRLARWLFKLF